MRQCKTVGDLQIYICFFPPCQTAICVPPRLGSESQGEAGLGVGLGPLEAHPAKGGPLEAVLVSLEEIEADRAVG